LLAFPSVLSCFNKNVSGLENDLQATWNAIVNGGVAKDPSTRLWRLHGDVQWVGKIKELYNRECYDNLLAKMKGNDTVLIKGTPGTGKSLFLMVLLVSIVEEARVAGTAIPSIKYVRVEQETVCSYQLASDGTVMYHNPATHGPPDYLLSDSVDLNIVDGKILSLEVASDSEKNYKNFEKRTQEAPSGLEYHMPLFSIEELLSIRGDMSEEEANFRYEVFGGSARNFKDRCIVSDIERLELVDQTMLWMFGAIKTSHEDWWNSVAVKVSKKLRQNDREIHKNTVNSLMRHRTELDVVVWASKFMEILSGVIMDEKVLEIHTALEEVVGKSGMGVAFESVGHKKISTCSEKYLLKPLHKPYQRNEVRRKEMLMRFNYPIQLIRTAANLSQLPKGSYGLPIHGYFPLADFVVKTEKETVIGNFTISQTHKGTAKQLNEILEHIHQKNHRVVMVWVVPSKNLNTFQWVKGLKDIDQYVMTDKPVSLKRKGNTPPKEKRAKRKSDSV
jgi:hypothetical protein